MPEWPSSGVMQLKPKEIAEIDGVDLVLGAAEKFNLPQHLNNLTDTTETSVIAGPIDVVKDFLPASLISGSHALFSRYRMDATTSVHSARYPGQRKEQKRHY